MDSATRARMASMLNSSEGRPLSELVKTKEILKGAESQRLRTFCTSNTMSPARDLDAYARLLQTGDVAAVRAEFAQRVARHTAESTMDSTTQPTPEDAAAQEIYALAWGPTRLAVYNVLLHFRVLFPAHAPGYLAILRFLALEARVPVDMPDLSGTQALSVAIGTKPIVDLDVAQVLLAAGGDVNARNRYGATAAHEILQIWTPRDAGVVARAARALEWFLAHGGNTAIADGDGMRPRDMALRLASAAPGLLQFIEDADRVRGVRAQTVEGCCALCGRGAEEARLLKCGRCRAVRYCAPTARACQVLDWPQHKKSCVRSTPDRQAAATPSRQAADGGFAFLGTKIGGASDSRGAGCSLADCESRLSLCIL
ncbi:hypothetical protein B0H15DRAFT_852315 [Mycena belliarum]|uniref:MYND-type domain-containing protein n=1 Tax=Mycena belliarum TaxID=1033014 RepID=A0AAD6TX51_9AGAR|nr:hypothetical protein B0H15DRAFT_852315 [Mycena belliae]